MEVVVAIVAVIAGALVGIAAIVAQAALWRREGPLARVVMYPAALGPHQRAVGMHAKDMPGATEQAVAVSIYSTGRHPIFVDGILFFALPPWRKRVWRKVTLQRSRHRWSRRWKLARPMKPEPMLIPLGDVFVDEWSGRVGRIEAAERRDIFVQNKYMLELEDKGKAKEFGFPGPIFAVVSLGNGRTIRSKPFLPSDPPKSPFVNLEEDGGEVPGAA